MSQDSTNPYSHPSPRHRAHLSLVTRASGVADSTISYNTYATGISEGSLNLSQFPPPPATLPSSSPVVERFLPSPSLSTFTVPVPPRVYPGIDQRPPSPARSTLTVTASVYSGVDQEHPSPSWSTYTFTPRAQIHASRSATPTVRPGFVLDRDLPSPALSTFTITPPLPISPAPPLPAADAQQILFPSSREFSDDGCSSREHGKPERTQNFDTRAEPQSPTPSLMDGKLSPHDWHEGSSILSVDPAEERMLSTSLITDLLSSNTPDKIPSPGEGSPVGLHPPPSQAGVSNYVYEMSYPPLSLRHNEPVAGPGRFLPTSHPPAVPGEVPNSRIDRENDTMSSCSHDEHLNIVRNTEGLTRRLSVEGMASETSVSDSLLPGSQVTCGSTTPLNPYPPPAFSSAMNKLQTTATQPPLGVSQHWTPERPLSPDFSSGKRPVKSQRRASAHSSRTVRSHVSSLISSVGHRTARAARATMGWMRVKPLPPIPTIPRNSIYEEQEHRRMEGTVPLPQLVDRADRLVVMLDSGHLPQDTIIRATSRFSSDKASPISPRMLHSFNSDKGPPGGPHSPWKFKLFSKLTTNRSRKIKLFIGASVLALLVLIGIIVGVVVGRRHGDSESCPANRTGNTCSLGEYSVPWLDRFTDKRRFDVCLCLVGWSMYPPCPESRQPNSYCQ